jgi:hypothetical protein
MWGREAGRLRSATDLSVGRNVERLAKDILLHLWFVVFVALLSSALAKHLVFWPDVHRDLQECLVQEGNAGLETPSQGGPSGAVRSNGGQPQPHALVSPEAIRSVQILHSTDTFLVERTSVGSCMEIEITCVVRGFSLKGETPGRRKGSPPKISSLPSPLKTILTPIALILRLRRYIGVLALTVVTS